MRDSLEEALTWTRPDFLALRYELRAPEGLVAQVSVTGMGDLKHAVGETSEGRWRFQVFPFASDIVSITRDEDHAELGSYLRQLPFEIRVTGAGTYRMGHAEASTTNLNPQPTLEDDAGQPRVLVRAARIVPAVASRGGVIRAVSRSRNSRSCCSRSVVCGFSGKA